MWDESLTGLFNLKQSTNGDAMQDFFNLTLLVLAAIASMFLGVLVAYAMFKAGFAAMHWHTQQAAPGAVKARAAVVRAS